MTGVIDDIKARSAHAARRAAFGAGATAFILVGVGFLTSAAWMMLAQMQSPLFAATVIGCAYVGIGLVGVGIAVSSSDTSRPTIDASIDASHASSEGKRAADLPPLAEAFVFGLNAGLSADQRRTKRPH
jgi:Putative Actinobacterial Holin-X, holin superfamily III